MRAGTACKVLFGVLVLACVDDPVAPPPPPIEWAEVSAGRDHTCAIARNGITYCWGRGSFGALGSDTRIALEPTPVDSVPLFAEVAAGGEHTCGVSAESVVLCWGRNTHAELGNGTTQDTVVPTPTGRADVQIISLTAGSDHNCGLDPDGLAFCWGWNFYGQIGNGSTVDQGLPVFAHGSERFAQISAGRNHTCAVTRTGGAYCWGQNDDGQLGDGTRTGRLTPTLVDLPGTVARISAGDAHSCALLSNGAAYCWGRGNLGELGTGSANSSLVPAAVIGGASFTTIAAGGQHTCAVDTSARAWCWGYNEDGRTGTAVIGLVVSAPEPVIGDVQFSQISAGQLHTCGVTPTAEIRCWGFGGFGQLGTGSTASEGAPRRTAEPVAVSTSEGGS